MASPLLLVPQGGPVKPDWKAGDRAFVVVPDDPTSDWKWPMVPADAIAEWARSVTQYDGLAYEIAAIHSESADPYVIMKHTDGSTIPLRWLKRPEPVFSAVTRSDRDRWVDHWMQACDEARRERDNAYAERNTFRLAHDKVRSECDSLRKTNVDLGTKFDAARIRLAATEKDAKELDQTRVQLAGCLVAAEGGATGSNDVAQGDYGWSRVEAEEAARSATYTRLRSVISRNRSPICPTSSLPVNSTTRVDPASSCTVSVSLLAPCRSSGVVTVAAINTQIDMGKPVSLISMAFGFGTAIWLSMSVAEENTRLKRLLQEKNAAPVKVTARRWF